MLICFLLRLSNLYLQTIWIPLFLPDFFKPWLSQYAIHTVGLSEIIAAELQQIRKEAVIGTSKILTVESKDDLRKVSLLSEPLFGGNVKELYKENAEQQQNTFIAQSAASLKSQTHSNFKVPRGAPPKKSKPAKRPPNPLEPPTRGGHSGSGSRRRADSPPLKEPPDQKHTDVSPPLSLPRSNLW